MSTPTISAYVPRGPVASAIHQLRDVVIIVGITVILATAWTNYNATRTVAKVNRLQTKIDALQAENSKLKTAADAGAVAGQQALGLLGQSIANSTQLSPAQRQVVVTIINQVIDQVAQNLKKSGAAPPTPVPHITLLPMLPVPTPSLSLAPPVPRAVTSNALDWRLTVQCPVVCASPQP